tara:strand:- start:836 stop:1084 length:249 start_codon:yes stop_codon:yes gene_type:complete
MIVKRKLSYETKLKMSLSHLGKKHSLETRLKMVKSQQIRINKTDYIPPFKNKHHSLETRSRLSGLTEKKLLDSEEKRMKDIE